ncbi:MAG: phosphoesterase, partial [Candidatus Sulfotelmatobacter sp.]
MYLLSMKARALGCAVSLAMWVLVFPWAATAQSQNPKKHIVLPSSKILMEPVPGMPRPINSFPATLAVHPSHRYVAILNNGYGTEEARFQQSIAILNLDTDQLQDFPDPRFLVNAHQTYFLGLGFSPDGSRLYVSVASVTDPAGASAGDLGNGIAVYGFRDGTISPQRFIKIPLQRIPKGKQYNPALPILPQGMAIP